MLVLGGIILMTLPVNLICCLIADLKIKDRIKLFLMNELVIIGVSLGTYIITGGR